MLTSTPLLWLPDELLVQLAMTLTVHDLVWLCRANTTIAHYLRPYLDAAHVLLPVHAVGWALRPIPCWQCYDEMISAFDHPFKGVRHSKRLGWAIDIPSALHAPLLSNPHFVRLLARLVPFSMWPIPSLHSLDGGAAVTEAVLDDFARRLEHPPSELERLVRFYAMDHMYSELHLHRLGSSSAYNLHRCRCVACCGRFPMRSDEMRAYHWASLGASRIRSPCSARFRLTNGPPDLVWWHCGMGGSYS